MLLELLLDFVGIPGPHRCGRRLAGTKTRHGGLAADRPDDAVAFVVHRLSVEVRGDLDGVVRSSCECVRHEAPLLVIGAKGGTRTPTGGPPREPKSRASTGSATFAEGRW